MMPGGLTVVQVSVSYAVTALKKLVLILTDKKTKAFKIASRYALQYKNSKENNMGDWLCVHNWNARINCPHEKSHT
jgi:hypothetical protein